MNVGDGFFLLSYHASSLLNSAHYPIAKLKILHAATEVYLLFANIYVGLIFLQLPKSHLRRVHKMFHENTLEV